MMTCSEDCHYFLSAPPQECHRLRGRVPWIPKGSPRDPQSGRSKGPVPHGESQAARGIPMDTHHLGYSYDYNWIIIGL